MTKRRIWFKPSKTDGLNLTDCNILNSAARRLWPGPENPSAESLAELHRLYDKGMSVSNLVRAYNA